MLIGTNGRVTEFENLKALRNEPWVRPGKVTVVFEGGSPLDLVRGAAQRASRDDYDEVWAVCDVDAFDPDPANNEADQLGVRVVVPAVFRGMAHTSPGRLQNVPCERWQMRRQTGQAARHLGQDPNGFRGLPPRSRGCRKARTGARKAALGESFDSHVADCRNAQGSALIISLRSAPRGRGDYSSTRAAVKAPPGVPVPIMGLGSNISTFVSRSATGWWYAPVGTT